MKRHLIIGACVIITMYAGLHLDAAKSRVSASLVSSSEALSPTEVIQDGSFEAGSPNPYWSVWSSSGVDPIYYSETSGARTGSWFLNFYGLARSIHGVQAIEQFRVEQDVVLPAGANATLSFYLRTLVPTQSMTEDTKLLQTGSVLVEIDSIVIFFTDESDPAYWDFYTLVTLDVSGFADGGTHLLSITGAVDPGWYSFSIDDVSLIAPDPLCATPGGGCQNQFIYPPDGATEVVLQPTFQWQCVNDATMYSLYLNDGVQTILIAQTAETSFTPTEPLAQGTTYHVGAETLPLCATAIHTFTTAQAPIADFSWFPTIPAIGETVTFVDLSSGSPTSWLWDFGDGGTSGMQNPAYVFSAAGTYDVTLTVTNALGSHGVAKQLIVGAPPAAAFTWSPTVPAPGESVAFVDLSSEGPTSWLWDFGDGGTSALQNPTHTFVDAGSYVVTLTVSNIHGTDEVMREVVVEAEPQCVLDVDSPNGGEQWMQGQEYSITWTLSGDDCGSDVRIDLLRAGIVAENVTLSTENDQSYVWSVPVDLEAGVSYRIRIEDNNGYWDDSDADFTIVDSTSEVDFTWWPVSAKAGEPIRFAAQLENTGISYLWDFGDGLRSSVQNPVHLFKSPSTFTVVLDVEFPAGWQSRTHTISLAARVVCGDGSCDGYETAWNCEADCDLPAGQTGRAGGADTRSFISAAAGGVPGEGGTLWVTEGMVFNPGSDAAMFLMEFTPDNSWPGTVFSAGPFSLGSETAMYFENIVEELFEKTSGGSLWLDSAESLMFSTRSFTGSDQGTYGQSVPAVRQSMVLGKGDGKVYLVGLSENASFRSNLIIQEVTGEAVQVEVRVFAPDGAFAGSRTFDVNGHSKTHKRLAGLDITNLTWGYATLEVVDGEGQFAAIGSVVDNITGDATTIDAVHPSQVLSFGKSETHSLIAVVARTEGEANTDWRSLVTIMNPASGAEAQEVRLEYWRANSPVLIVNRTLAAGEAFVSEDVVGDLFPNAGDGKGALHIYAPQGLIASSRTYTPPSGGTYGQPLPGLDRGDLIEPGQVGVFKRLKHTDDFRCNVGFTEYSGINSTVSITLYDMGGFAMLWLGEYTVEVPAMINVHVGKIFEKIAVDTEHVGVIAYVTVAPGGGSIYAYATNVDNASGDAETIVAQPR